MKSTIPKETIVKQWGVPKSLTRGNLSPFIPAPPLVGDSGTAHWLQYSVQNYHPPVHATGFVFFTEIETSSLNFAMCSI